MIGIGCQVHDYLVDLGRIGHDRATVRINILTDFNGRREGGSYKIHRLI